MPLLRAGLRAGRILIVAAVLVPVLAVLGLVATARLFVWPPTDPVEQADAVVVLAGGHGERLERGLDLVRNGVAPTLVLSFGPPEPVRRQPRAVRRRVLHAVARDDAW